MKSIALAGGVLAAALLILQGCAGRSEWLGKQQADASYKKQVMRFSGGGGNCEVTVYTKFFNSEDLLAACGFASVPCSYPELKDLWFSHASMVVDGKDVSSGSFILAKNVEPGMFNVDAACIRTKEAWKEAYQTSVPRFVGTNVQANY